MKRSNSSAVNVVERRPRSAQLKTPKVAKKVKAYSTIQMTDCNFCKCFNVQAMHLIISISHIISLFKEQKIGQIQNYI